MRFPRADGFLYCITLRFGVYCVCLYDTVSGVFDVVGSVTTLMYPEIMLRSQVAPPTPEPCVLCRSPPLPRNSLPLSFPGCSLPCPRLPSGSSRSLLSMQDEPHTTTP
jgi:hypothetical protein